MKNIAEPEGNYPAISGECLADRSNIASSLLRRKAGFMVLPCASQLDAHEKLGQSSNGGLSSACLERSRGLCLAARCVDLTDELRATVGL